MSKEIFEKLKTPVKSVPENLAYVSIRNFDRMHCMENILSSMLIPKNVFRTTNPENFSSIELILSMFCAVLLFFWSVIFGYIWR